MLVSCFSEESKVLLPDLPAEDLINTIPIGPEPEYLNQHFFSLGDNKILASNNRYDWDLAFENRNGEFDIWLNGAQLMQVFNTRTTNFDSTFQLGSYDFQIDEADGSATAVGEWGNFEVSSPISLRWVYLINLGEGRGEVKFQIDSFTNNTYHIRIADFDGDDLQTLSIEKTNETEFLYYHIATNRLVDIEPENWDLFFTRYSDNIANGPDTVSYVVTGLFIHPKTMLVAEPMIDYDSVTLDYANTLVYSRARDVIGYDWKDVDFDNFDITIRENNLYVIKSSSGTYKLKFTDYFDKNNVKGYPQVFYRRLD